jgi:hypothetical protein
MVVFICSLYTMCPALGIIHPGLYISFTLSVHVPTKHNASKGEATAYSKAR